MLTVCWEESVSHQGLSSIILGMLILFLGALEGSEQTMQPFFLF